MSTIVTRAGKGSALTHNEVDANFTNLNTDKLQSGNTAAALTITSATIAGGTINGTTVGATTPAAGTFTDLTANNSAVVSVNTSSNALRITQTGTGNALVVEDSTNPDSTPFVVDANGRIIDGYTVALSNYYDFGGTVRTPQIQLQGASLSTAGFAQTNWASANSPPAIYLSKSRSGTIGAQGVVLSGDSLGAIQFNGDDATNFIPGAAIFGQVDGTPGTNDMPGRLVFSTTADGASTPTEQMRLTSTGDLRFNSGYGSVATAYGCRAWVNFNGTATSNLTGTYSQTGTVVTVTATAHGLITGNIVYLDITSGTAVDGVYTVTVTDVNTFTVTQASRTTSGNVTLVRSTIRASGNVSSVADNAAGDYTVNFATAMPDANYSTVGQVTSSTILNTTRTIVVKGTDAGGATNKTTSACQFLVGGTASSVLVDMAEINVAIFR